MLITEHELPKLREALKNSKVVLARGTFDILHDGHLDYLEWCGKQGDILVVAVGGDQRTKARKGSLRPIFDQDTRLRIVDALEIVNYVVMVEDVDTSCEAPIKTARLLQPDIVCLGSDESREGIKQWRQALPNTRILIDPQSKLRSTTKIVSSILASLDKS